MKTIKIITALLLLSFTAYAQNGDKMRKLQDQYGFVTIEEKTNFRSLESSYFKRDGTPYPRWQSFGFKAIYGNDPVYRAFKEVLTTSQINLLVATGKEMGVSTIFNIEGNVLEVIFLFSDEEYNAVSSIISMDNFYNIAQQVKQYDKYEILEDDPEDLDVQWISGFFFFKFDKVRDWKLIEIEGYEDSSQSDMKLTR